jgi:DNA-binding IclR family transcriptional regulator
MARVGGRPRTALVGGAGESSDVYVQALARGLSILALFDVEHPEWSLHDIARQTGISKTTVYRMLRTLERKAFLAFDPATERYHLGHAIIPCAYLSLSNMGFARSTHSFLEDLAADTGETVELAVEGEGGAVVVDHVATSHPFKPNLPLGRVLRSLANSAMKVLVAYRTEADRERLLQVHQAKLTPMTVTDPQALRDELSTVAKEALAFDMEEHDVGVCAVSAPIFGLDGDIRAVITLVAPAERFGAEERGAKIEAVQESAAAISRYLQQASSAVMLTGPRGGEKLK